MPLVAFRENFLNRLKSSVRENLRRYRDDKPWVDDLPWSQSPLPTPLEPTEPLRLLEPDPEDLRDLENSIRVFSALPNLTPIQASDPRLWTRLTHVECWKYMRLRWPVERMGNNANKAERFILSRYFIQRNESRALLRNGLARLWWYAYVTHDPDKSNPYELTSVLLSTLDITQQIMERSLGRMPHVTSGFLEFLLYNKKKLLGPGDQKRRWIRHLAKRLNLFGGVTLLDCLTKSEIVEVLEEEFERLQERPEIAASA